MKIQARDNVELKEGMEFEFFNNSQTPTRVGDSFGLFQGEKRVGLARISEDLSKNPRYTNAPYGHEHRNLGKGFFRAILETLYGR